MPEPKKVLLAVLAHPDDESFGTGGTLALYARKKGVEVHLICATQGEAGDVESGYLEGFSSIAERRVSELRCAAGILGLSGVHFLGYRDSGMPGSPDNQHPNALVNQPVEKVAGQIREYFHKLQPQVVITFDPIGGYRHPDHIAIHKATVLAFETVQKNPQAFLTSQAAAAFIPQKLYFQTISRTYIRLGVLVMRLLRQDPRHFGKNRDIDLQSIAEITFPTNARIDYRPVSKERDAAAACHASQGGQMQGRGIMRWVRRLAGTSETYMRAFPPPEPGIVERDLFMGL